MLKKVCKQLIVFAIILVSNSISAQTVTVSGTVSEVSGPLPGVNVVVKGTDNGTSTDFDGNYVLNNVDANATLVFSFVGYITKEVPLNGQTTINVTLDGDSQALDEVVVVGYGSQNKRDITGAVSSIKGAAIKQVVASNPTIALQGKITGVQVESFGGQPGGPANVFIRGISSLTNSFPLYVVDGMIVNDLYYLNSKDFKNIQVLKDAASAAIYGSRAANGVVIVTTDRGTTDTSPKVTLDIRAGVDTPSRLLDYLNGPQFEQYRNQLEQNDGTGFVFPSTGVSTDWQDLSLNNGSVEDYGFSVSGGGESSSYLFSSNYFKQDGILVGSGFEKINVRLNSKFNVGKVKIEESLSLAQTKLQTNDWFGFEGSTAPILRRNVPENEGGFEAPEFSIHNFGGINKFALATLEDNLLTSRNVLGSLSASYEIVEGLTGKVNVGVDYVNQYYTLFRPTYFMSNSDALNNLNELNDLTETRSETLSTIMDGTLTYKKSFGKSNIQALIGVSRQDIDGNALSTTVNGLPSNDIRNVGAADASNVVATGGQRTVSGLLSYFGNINYKYDDKYLLTASMRRDASSKFRDGNRVGYFPSFSVGWRVSNEDFWNEDGVVNTLKVRAGYGELGSQNIADYAYQSVFGLTSNTAFGEQQDFAFGYALTQLVDEDIKWEVSKTLNVGIDATLLNNKLSLTADYFNKDVEDVLVAVSIPSSSGTSLPVIQNAGNINNRGFELGLNYTDSPSENFNYSVGFNLATVKNELTSLPNPIIGPGVDEDGRTVNRFIEGQPLGVFFGYTILGVYPDQASIDNDPNTANDPVRRSLVQPGDFQRADINGDGMVTVDDQSVIGDPTPDFTYGINFAGNYKNLDFSLFFQGVQGNEIWNQNKFFNTFWSDDNKLVDVLRAWTPTNTITDVPRATTSDAGGNRAASTYFVEDGSYLRLKTVEIGYTFNEKLAVDWIGSARVYLNAQNLFVITDYTGYDPDVASTSGGRSPRGLNPILGRGIDARAYPNARTFTVGLQLGF